MPRLPFLSSLLDFPGSTPFKAIRIIISCNFLFLPLINRNTPPPSQVDYLRMIIIPNRTCRHHTTYSYAAMIRATIYPQCNTLRYVKVSSISPLQVSAINSKRKQNSARNEKRRECIHSLTYILVHAKIRKQKTLKKKFKLTGNAMHRSIYDWSSQKIAVASAIHDRWIATLWYSDLCKCWNFTNIILSHSWLVFRST